MPLHCSVGMSWGVVLFTTFGGLRGAVSLILAQILVLDQEKKVLSSRHITAEARSAATRCTKLAVMCILLAAGSHLACLDSMPPYPCCHNFAQMALWTSGFVVLTLIINAPLMPWLLKVTGCVAHTSPHAMYIANTLDVGWWLIGAFCTNSLMIGLQGG